MMKTILMASASSLAIAGVPSQAAVVFIDSTPGTTSFTVATAGSYEIDAFGAQGGSATGGRSTYVGGMGYGVAGTFALTAGEVLDIAVGGRGLDGFIAGGGGGGSFVTVSGAPLIIGGGGGGAGFHARGYGGLKYAGTSPGLGGPGGGGFAGSGGNGASGYYAGGGGGGGFPSLAGGTPGAQPHGQAPNGAGGFGGGGGGAYYGGGGGGGYSGGAGGGSYYGGRGGGYLNHGAQARGLGFQSGDGLITISSVPSPAPEPSSWSLMLTGLGFLGYVLRRRMARTA